jgi:hypothetical protein
MKNGNTAFFGTLDETSLIFLTYSYLRARDWWFWLCPDSLVQSLLLLFFRFTNTHMRVFWSFALAIVVATLFDLRRWLAYFLALVVLFASELAVLTLLKTCRSCFE